MSTPRFAPVAIPVHVRIIKLIDANKTKAAFLAPVFVALGAAVGSWIVTGEFNDSEIRTAVGGAALAACSGLATWLTKTKTAVAEVTVAQNRDVLR